MPFVRSRRAEPVMAGRGPVDPRLLRHARPALPGLAGLVGLGALSAVATAASLVAGALLVAALVARLRHGSSTGIGVEVAVLVVAVVARALAAGAAPAVAARTAGRVVDRLRGSLLTAPGVTTPARRALATHGVDELRGWFTGYVPALVLAVVLPPLAVVTLLVVDVPSGLVVIATLPLLPVFAVLLGWATQARARRRWAAGERLAGRFLDVVTGLATLRLFGRARRQVDEVGRVGEEHRRATMSVLRVAFLSSTALDLVATVSVGLVAVSAGLRVVDGSLGLGPALVAILLAPEAYRPVREVGARFHDVAAVAPVLDGLDAELGAAVAAPATPGSGGGLGSGGGTPSGGGPAVAVRDLRVRYPGAPGDALVLDRLDVAAGEVVALAGASGAGKTTLLRTLTGALAARAGTATVAGPLLPLPQRPTLPHARTVREAVLGEGAGGDEEARDALRRVGLELDPDAPLAEAGASVSAGQRQRLALAHLLHGAAAAPASVVLLDEPTAHLDAATERLVLDAVFGLAAAGAAVLLVAHRPAALAAATRTVTVTAPPQVTAAPVAPAASGPGAAVVEPGRPAPRAEGARRLVAGAGSVLAGLALTAASSWLIVRADARPPVLTLSLAVVAVRATAIARPLLRHLERLAVHDTGLRRVVAWRRRLVADLVDRVPGAVTGRRGELLAGLVDDVDTRLDGLVRGRQPLLVAAVVLPVVLAAAALALPAAGPVLALAAGLGVVAATAVGAALVARGDGRATDRARAALLSAVVEAGEADGDPAVPRRRMRDDDRARRRAGAHEGLADALAHLGLGVATVGAAVAAAGLAPGSASPELVAVVVLVPLALTETLLGLPGAARALVRARQARDRLAAVAASPPPATEPPVPWPLPAGSGLVARDLVAGWDRAVPPALDGVDLDLDERRRIGVTGASGSGKSTLAAVAVRLLDARGGVVSLGGSPLAGLTGDAVRTRVGLVGDPDHVFDTSVRENLRLAAPGADDAALAAVLARVRLAGWAGALDTPISAATVSGGERRRLVAARALLADPAVLVLDEPTEGLDGPTARGVVDDLLAGDRSVLLLAHRAEGLDRVDRVLALEGGRLVDGAQVKSPAA